jgi:tRNA 2-selenouridine synthase
MSAPTSTRIDVPALVGYPERIDVRSPAEFALDHLPGAVNLPVLDDGERAEVGTLHARESAFAARRRGAALVTRNIARILETHCADRPKEWAPVVYCWRGGKRSGALTHILNEIGWRAVQLHGGYRAYRRHVVATLSAWPGRLRFHVICGLTGSGKSRLLAALAARGAQVLDLEALARHRGSLLGDLPGDPQPSQKWFESQVLDSLERLDREQPVYVESESRKIGSVQVPESLLAAMRGAPCVEVATPRALRVALLRDEYAHFLRDPALLAQSLAPLSALYGNGTIERWTRMAESGDFATLIDELLARHYDRLYARSIARNFPHIAEAIRLVPSNIEEASFDALAAELDGRVRALAPCQPVEFPR